MKKMSLQYIAGIFDGEGCVGIYGPTDKKGYKRYVLYCSVAQSGEWLPYKLQMAFGGYVTKTKRNTPHRDSWLWSIMARQAADFLTAIYPYLYLKKPQVEVALEFQRQRGRKGVRLTDEQRAVAEAQRLLIASLKKSNNSLEVIDKV